MLLLALAPLGGSASEWLAHSESRLSMHRLRQSYGQAAVVAEVLQALVPELTIVGDGKTSTPATLARVLCDYWRQTAERDADARLVAAGGLAAATILVSMPFELGLELVAERHAAVKLQRGQMTCPLPLVDDVVLPAAWRRHHNKNLRLARRHLPTVLQNEAGRLADVLQALSAALATDLETVVAPHQLKHYAPAGAFCADWGGRILTFGLLNVSFTGLPGAPLGLGDVDLVAHLMPLCAARAYVLLR